MPSGVSYRALTDEEQIIQSGMVLASGEANYADFSTEPTSGQVPGYYLGINEFQTPNVESGILYTAPRNSVFDLQIGTSGEYTVSGIVNALLAETIDRDAVFGSGETYETKVFSDTGDYEPPVISGFNPYIHYYARSKYSTSTTFDFSSTTSVAPASTSGPLFGMFGAEPESDDNVRPSIIEKGTKTTDYLAIEPLTINKATDRYAPYNSNNTLNENPVGGTNMPLLPSWSELNSGVWDAPRWTTLLYGLKTEQVLYGAHNGIADGRYIEPQAIYLVIVPSRSVMLSYSTDITKEYIYSRMPYASNFIPTYGPVIKKQDVTYFGLDDPIMLHNVAIKTLAGAVDIKYYTRLKHNLSRLLHPTGPNNIVVTEQMLYLLHIDSKLDDYATLTTKEQTEIYDKVQTALLTVLTWEELE